MKSFFAKLGYHPKKNERLLLIILTCILSASFLFVYITQNQKKSKATGDSVALLFDPASVSIASGEAFTVTVNAKPNVDMSIQKYNFEIDFDKTKAQVKDIQYKIGTVSTGSGDDNSSLTTVNSLGAIKLQAETASTSAQVLTSSQATPVATLTFESKTTEQYPITIKPSDGNFYKQNSDTALTAIPITSAGDLVVNGPSPSDLHLKVKFQGALKKPQEVYNNMSVKVMTVSATGEESEAKASFTSDDQGFWSGSPSLPIRSGSGYSIYIKGPNHLQKRICDQNPTESVAGKYSCTTGGITLAAQGDNSFNFSNIYLLVGDLPTQDGIVNSYDISLVRNNLGKNDIETLKKADLNLDGIVDSQDYSLVIAALGIQREDDQIVTITPSPTPTVTTTVAPSAIPTLTETPSPSPSPTP